MKTTPITLLLLLFIILLFSALACASGSTVEPTAESINQNFALTLTAKSDTASDSNAPLLTAQADATAQAQALQATQAANQAASSEEQKATAAAEAPIKGELSIYGIETENGHVAWIHPPVTLDVDSYMAMDYANDYPATVVKDFVMAADITWNTEYGTSGCGFMLRSDGDQNTPSTYVALITRGASGHLLFGIVEKGEPDGGYDFFPREFDHSFDWHNDVTNRLTVMGRGSVFTFYTNGIKIGEVDLKSPPPKPVIPAPPAALPAGADATQVSQYEQRLKEYKNQVEQIQENYASLLSRFESDAPIYESGFVGLVAVSESGHTICSFDNAWLWMFDE